VLGDLRKMAKAGKRNDVCRLCLNVGELRYSHIVSEFLYEPLYDEKHRFLGIRPISRDAGKPERTLQKGIREYLLCDECEKGLAEYERYSAGLLRSLPPTAHRRPGEILEITGVDYQAFKLFQMSLLWRAGIASHPVFQEVDLGPHEDRLRTMITDGDPGEPWEYGCVMVALRGPGTIERVMRPPRKMRMIGHFAYSFIHWGLLWFYVVSHHANSLSGQGSFLSKTGVLTLHVGTTTAGDFMSEWKRNLVQVGVI